MIFLIAWCLATDPLAGTSVSIARAGVNATASLSTSQMPLSGEVRLDLTAEGDAPLKVDAVSLADSPAWRIRDAGSAGVVDQPGRRQRWHQSFRLTPGQTGELQLKPPILRVRAGGRDVPVELDLPALGISVTSSIRNADVDDARGVTGPEPTPAVSEPLWYDPRAWALAIGMIAVTAAILAGRSRPAPVPERPPFEWVTAQLVQLREQQPNADRLANGLRAYLTQQFEIPALGKTTDDVTALLASRDAAAGTHLSSAWRSLLERCDVARFGNREFHSSEWLDVLNHAKDVITESLPVAEPGASAAAGTASEKA